MDRAGLQVKHIKLLLLKVKYGFTSFHFNSVYTVINIMIQICSFCSLYRQINFGWRIKFLLSNFTDAWMSRKTTPVTAFSMTSHSMNEDASEVTEACKQLACKQYTHASSATNSFCHLHTSTFNMLLNKTSGSQPCFVPRNISQHLKKCYLPFLVCSTQQMHSKY